MAPRGSSSAYEDIVFEKKGKERKGRKGKGKEKRKGKKERKEEREGRFAKRITPIAAKSPKNASKAVPKAAFGRKEPEGCT